MLIITKNNLLKYIPDNIETEYSVNPARIYELNKKPIKTGYIVYLCEREIRAKDNFALRFSIEKSKKLNLPLKILSPEYNCSCKDKENFINTQISQVKNVFTKFGFDFEILSEQKIHEFLKERKIALLVVDFNPILKRDYLKNIDYKIYEIDGHNIIPAKYISDKQEYNAATLRRKIYKNIYPFLTEYENIINYKSNADIVLEDFIQNKLPYYAEYKNNPNKNILSGLSKYLNLGFISSQRIMLEVIRSNTIKDNKEAFLEELIIRKELADNFCLYSDSFKTLKNIPLWAKNSLKEHRNDIRLYTYNIENFENCNTHDLLWNATQKQLMSEGIIHGYLRMYWAKKIAEWTNSIQEALRIAIYLNDKYAYDAPSANGYTGILWAIAGLHDRAFKNWFVTGKIRRMSITSLKNKFDIEAYISKYPPQYPL